MSMGFNRECPKCHADRTLLETSFGLPGCVDPASRSDAADSIRTTGALPVRLVLCPRCHLLEMYHDVGLGNLT